MKDCIRNIPPVGLMLAAIVSTLDNPVSSFVTTHIYRRALQLSCRQQEMGVQTLLASAVPTINTAEEKKNVAKRKQEAGPMESALRSAAMQLHTREQAPKEGKKETKPPVKQFVPTIHDYVQFLVDSKYVYETFEKIVNNDKYEELSVLRQTGLERVASLEKDLKFVHESYNVDIPNVGRAGKKYAAMLQALMDDGRKRTPEFICHYYNHYFAHTAGGRMIGKKMSSLLLDGRTLEFYKWEGDLNNLKQQVKEKIEAMALGWDEEQREACVGATSAAFQGGGALNSYLFGGSQH